MFQSPSLEGRKLNIGRKGVVYEIRNKITNLPYIGVTFNEPEQRFSNHFYEAFGQRTSECTHLNRSIRKHGRDAFELILLYENVPVEYLGAMERVVISLYDSKNNGYNLTDGGEGITGYKHTDEAKRKIGEASKGNTYAAGTKWTAERRVLMHDILIKQRHTPEMKEHLRQVNLGKKHSEETKDKLRKVNIGRKRPQWVKEKISASMKALRKRQRLERENSV